jgi:hypothetical protein
VSDTCAFPALALKLIPDVPPPELLVLELELLDEPEFEYEQ